MISLVRTFVSQLWDVASCFVCPVADKIWAESSSSATASAGDVQQGGSVVSQDVDPPCPKPLEPHELYIAAAVLRAAVFNAATGWKPEVLDRIADKLDDLADAMKSIKSALK